MRRPLLTLVVTLLLVATGFLVSPATAAPAANWAQWSTPAGTSHDFRGSLQLPARGFPATSWTSTSRSPVQLPSGATSYLSGSTPPGARYGSSQGNAYLNLRPYADNATSPSTTTFDFAAATPTSGWTFVLGDIDADKVRIEAHDATGRPVPDDVIDRWERGAFNTGSGNDRPTWQPRTATLFGNPGAVDTTGASDWFEPDVALSSLTFVYSQRAGFPVYQVWFASLSHDITGRVAGTTQCPATGATVRLLAPEGDELDTTTPAANGSYSFDGYAAQPGYTVVVDAPPNPPDSCLVAGADHRAVDLADGDGTADFALRDALPGPVGGTVTTSDSTPVAGATITLTPPTGPTRTVTTDDAGRYVIDGNAAGTGYRVTITAPDGYRVVAPAELTFDVVAGQAAPDQDFVLRELPAVSGTITDADGPLIAVAVSLIDEDGHRSRTVTDAAGRYAFDRLPSGAYTIVVTPPDGYAAPMSRDGVRVDSIDVTGQDFTLTRVGTAAGVVTRGRTPQPRVTVTVTGPTGTRRVSTAADGSYTAGDLAPGRYEVTVSPPAAYVVAGATSRAFTITAAGELVGGLDFALRAASAPTSTPTPTPTDTAGPSAVGSLPPAAPAASGGTAATGVPTASLLGLGALLLTLGSGTLAAARRRRSH